jgi:hypothetical protein
MINKIISILIPLQITLAFLPQNVALQIKSRRHRCIHSTI